MTSDPATRDPARTVGDDTADAPSTALSALDEATRAIAGVLDLESVLQLIVDRVRMLAGARYAALGTIGPDDHIERFITSGISDEERAAIGPLPTGHGLLGLLIRESQPVRVRRIADHPASVGFPGNHPPMQSFLGVPVTAHGRSIGNFYLTDKQGGAEFTVSDERLAETFALHAGIAIDNARLHEQVQQLAVVQERDRIGRDLHDGIIQSLYAVSLSLEDLPLLPPNEAEQRVDRAIDALHGAIRDIRHFIHGLAAEAVDGRDLPSGLLEIVNELRHNTIIEIDLSLDPTADPDLSSEDNGELLQLVREGLSNAARHANATRIVVALWADGRDAVVEVADDGMGFDPGAPAEEGHHGIANMRTRAEAIGAILEVRSEPGRGSRIIVRVPRARGKPEEGA